MACVEPNSPDAKFSVSVWQEHAKYFSTKEEAEAEFVRQRAAREYGCGELYEWDDQGGYEELSSFNYFGKAQK